MRKVCRVVGKLGKFWGFDVKGEKFMKKWIIDSFLLFKGERKNVGEKVVGFEIKEVVGIF